MHSALRKNGGLRRLATDAETRDHALQWLEYAREPNLETPVRFGAYLEAARLALADAVKGGKEDRLIYNAAIRAVVEMLQTRDFEPVQPQGASAVDGFALDLDGPELLDPKLASLFVPADQIRIKGLHNRSLQDGLGLPCAAWFAPDSEFLAAQPGVPFSGMAVPVTAVMTFEGARARLRFVRTLQRDTVVVDGRTVVLAGDYSAPLAIGISRGKNRILDPGAMFFTTRNISNMGLFQFQPYDPDRIPVVFVHGLLSRPEAWTQAVNTLLADREIRNTYQFWFYLYPTGLPVWASAAVLREDLGRFNQTFETMGPTNKLNHKILVGHSMGGLIASLMIREGGQALWGQFSDRPFDELELPPRMAGHVRRLLDFEPRDDVDTVVFVATPHRGSPLALRPVAGLAAGLIRLPLDLWQDSRNVLLSLLRDDAREAVSAPANSIRFLREDSPLLTSILELQRDRRVKLHSIIGDRGRPGKLEHSSDGIVPYRSSHLPGVESETIVPSGHGANEHPDGIETLRRILQGRATGK